MKNMSQFWRFILSQPSGLCTFGLTFLHQTMIAASSYFLIQLINAFQSHQDYFLFLMMYLVAMIIPYLPGCLSYIALQHWINRAHQHIVSHFSASAYGRIEAFRDHHLKNTVESAVSRNSFSVIGDYLNFIYGFTSFFLNSILSMLVLGFLLPGNLLSGYFSSLVICAIIILVMRKPISICSEKNERNFISFSTSLSKIWENATIGNQRNNHYWTQQRELAGNRYYKSAIELAWIRQTGNFLLAIVSLGPTIYLVFSAFTASDTSAMLIAAIIVNLTRIFHILNSLSTLVYDLLTWSSMNARLHVLFDAEQQLTKQMPLPENAQHAITMNAITIHRFSDALAMIKQAGHGRFTIQGANGSGKTTLLYYLKKAFPDNAIFIPAHYANLVWHTEIDHLSTGEKMLSQIRDGFEDQSLGVLLLDEWDANLDTHNKKEIDAMLQTLSKTKTIIEVRH